MFCCLALDSTSPVIPGALETLARACSPRLESHGDTAAMFDASGLGRVLGPPDHIGAEVRRLAADHGVIVHVCLASTMVTAWLIAHVRSGVSVVDPGNEAAALANVPLASLRHLPESEADQTAPRKASGRSARHYRLAPGPPVELNQSGLGGRRTGEMLSILERWGLRTLGDLARLPRADVRTRLGLPGLRLHEAACGEDPAPLVPTDEPRRFLERLELEWPIEGLEPLSFVLSRLCEALSMALERADRGAVAITTRLTLVRGTWDGDGRSVGDALADEKRLRPPRRANLQAEARQRAGVGPRSQLNIERVLRLPAPMRDARVLRTLVLLDLESHPPDAAIDVVELELDVTPGRIVQGSLLTYTLPSPENLATLIARLNALMGESRVGAPKLLDTHDERAVAMQLFNPISLAPGSVPAASCLLPAVGLRRFRLPIPARVITEHGAPIHVEASARGVPASRVLTSAGPWRTSGRWWTLDRSPWDRDEWDVELTTGVFRLARDRGTGHWEIEGVVD
jgi:protein ImuB